MLAYSDEWRLAGAHLVLADACSLPFPDGSIDVIVASLGDPYNLPAFWGEVARVLRSGGRALFTAPASEWATRFRAPECLDAAEFIRRDGTILLMPSPVLTEQEQISMFAEAGLAFEEVQTFSAVDLGSTPAPKLLCLDEGEPVLRGYVVRR
jgi:SAM-dependent methyltransferase